MKVTQLRENEHNEALSLLDLDRLLERIKTETKAQPVAGFRQTLQYLLPGESSQLAEKLPKIIPAALFTRRSRLLSRARLPAGIQVLSASVAFRHPAERTRAGTILAPES